MAITVPVGTIYENRDFGEIERIQRGSEEVKLYDAIESISFEKKYKVVALKVVAVALMILVVTAPLGMLVWKNANDLEQRIDSENTLKKQLLNNNIDKLYEFAKEQLALDILRGNITYKTQEQTINSVVMKTRAPKGQSDGDTQKEICDQVSSFIDQGRFSKFVQARLLLNSTQALAPFVIRNYHNSGFYPTAHGYNTVVDLHERTLTCSLQSKINLAVINGEPQNGQYGVYKDELVLNFKNEDNWTLSYYRTREAAE